MQKLRVPTLRRVRRATQSPVSLPSPLSIPAYRRVFVGRFLGVTAKQLITVSVSWDLYERTRSAWALGFVGLVQIVPVIGLVGLTGRVADRFDRARVALASEVLVVLASALLTWLGLTSGPVAATYLALFVLGVASAFHAPAISALTPLLVPKLILPRANAWTATGFQLAAILGPALAGALIAYFGSALPCYVAATVAALCYAALLAGLRGPPPEASRTVDRDWRAGLRFVLASPLLLAAMTLDLFSVLFAGVTALLPIFARDILACGPGGLGLLRSAPSVGALVLALVSTRLPPWRRPGRVLLAVVAGFGVVTVGFGLSTSFPLSLALLFLAGALDNVSVVIRITLEQMVTPDAIRGRVAAIHYVFIGMSNELGELESGAAAALVGPILATVGGGALTLVCVAAVMRLWPALAAMGPLAELQPAAAPPEALGGSGSALG
jgi:MFS family permease